LIKRFEEISMNAWPALHTMLYDGWVLRFADGYTRRANSVNPIYASTIDVNTKISYCEKMYTQKGLRTIFKMTEDICPLGLDRVLERKGYEREAETSVQTLRLDAVGPSVDPGAEIGEMMDDVWLDAFFRMSDADVKYKNTLRSMLGKNIQGRCIARVMDGNTIVACGIGIKEENTVGLFDIIVDKRLRGRGMGRKVTESILAWAKDAGAEWSYLQVMVDNTVARELYRKLGFREIYRYWYRVGVKSQHSTFS
jgi:ribosomal protein S18 acetylase RimI-like enzyme